MAYICVCVEQASTEHMCPVSCSAILHCIPMTETLADLGTELICGQQISEILQPLPPTVLRLQIHTQPGQLSVCREDVNKAPYPLGHLLSPHLHLETLKFINFCFKNNVSGLCE